MFRDDLTSYSVTRGQNKTLKYLVMGGHKYPVKIEHIRTSSDELPTFEGYILGKPEKVTSLDFEIERVIFNDPATIVIWKDGTKTVVKCQEGDVYDEEKGLSLCISKKALGNKGNFNEVFKKWVPEKVEINPLVNIATSVAKGFNNLSDALKKVNENKDEPKLYNARVRCVYTIFSWFTVGKIYDVVNGRLTNDNGETLRTEFESCDDINSQFNSKFEEVKEPSVKKMRYALDEFCEKIEDCPGCPLDCGYSCNFIEDNGHLMSDNQIKEAYKLAFGKKEDK